jgi:hypothetical protein
VDYSLSKQARITGLVNNFLTQGAAEMQALGFLFMEGWNYGAERQSQQRIL